MLTIGFLPYSCPHQAQPLDPADQVQGQMPPLHLHPCPEGLRQGRQAQAEPAPRCVANLSSIGTAPITGHYFGECCRVVEVMRGILLNVKRGSVRDLKLTLHLPTALKVVDVSKGDKKKAL